MSSFNPPLSGYNAVSTITGIERFPLQPSPICHLTNCHKICKRHVVTTNRSGNLGRPYYYCDFGHSREFKTWDDERGIIQGNPLCSCGYTTRRESINGHNSPGHYQCATRECKFWQNIVDQVDGDQSMAPAISEVDGTQSSHNSVSPASSPPRQGNTTTLHTEGHFAVRAPNFSPSMTPLPVRITGTPLQLGVSKTCPIHGNGKKRFFRLNRCKCSGISWNSDVFTSLQLQPGWSEIRA